MAFNGAAYQQFALQEPNYGTTSNELTSKGRKLYRAPYTNGFPQVDRLVLRACEQLIMLAISRDQLVIAPH
jgi:hypothetical protein